MPAKRRWIAMERRIIQVSIIISTVSTQGKCARQTFPHEVEPVSEQNLQKSVSHCFSLFAVTCNDGQCDAPRYQRVRAMTAFETKKKAPDCKFIDTKEECDIALEELNLKFGDVMEKNRDPKWYAKGCAWDRWIFGTFNTNSAASKCIWDSHVPVTDCICKI